MMAFRSKFAGDDFSKKPVGEEFIQEWKNPRTSAISFYCILCGCQFDRKLTDMHTSGYGHRRQYETYKERETTDDRLVNAKHSSVAISQTEYELVHEMVLNCEKALKATSDAFSQGQLAPKKIGAKKDEEGQGQHTLSGVMRSGLLATGLLMSGEIHVVLVLVTAEKPTETLLRQVADDLPKQLTALVGTKKYEVTVSVEEACIFVTAIDDPKPSVKIIMTSPTMRTHPFHYYNEIAPPDPADVLSRDQCEEALRGLRRARWFEAKAWSLPYIDIVLRIFRDLCERVPTWKPITLWMLEVLIQKCLGTVDGAMLSPSYAVQLVFECLASGILLPDSPGLYDPCEREPTDLCQQLTAQEREYITASAQHALRLITFDQLHKILGMSETALKTALQGGGGNKRRMADIESLTDRDGKKSRYNIDEVAATT